MVKREGVGEAEGGRYSAAASPRPQARLREAGLKKHRRRRLGITGREKIAEAATRCWRSGPSGQAHESRFPRISEVRDRPRPGSGSRRPTPPTSAERGLQPHCAFCIIPQIRRPFRSKPMESSSTRPARWRRGGRGAQSHRPGPHQLRARSLPPALPGRAARENWSEIGGVRMNRLLYCLSTFSPTA